MTAHLRVPLAAAYHRAALDEADMVSATRSFEAVRAADTAGEPPWAALAEVRRQAGLARDLRLVPALVELYEAIESRKAAGDVSELRELLGRHRDEGWREVRHRVTRALSHLNLLVVERILEAPLEPGVEAAETLSRWREYVHAIRLERWDRARPLFESLGQDPEMPAGDRARLLARATQIHLYYSQDRGAAQRTLEEARRLVEAPGMTPAARAEVLSAAGQFELEGGEVESGRRRLREAIEADPGFEDSYRWLGNSYLPESASGDADLQEAETWFNLGIENAPGGTLNVIGLALLLGRPESYRSRRLRIAELKQHALRVTPRHRHGLYATFAQIALDNGEFDEAARLAALARDDDPARPDAWILEARIHAGRDEFSSALRSFGAAYSADPGAFDHWIEVENLLIALSEEASLGIGIRDLEAAFPGAPPERVASLSALLLLAQGDWEGAKTASEKALDADGELEAHRRRMARIHNVRGNRSYSDGRYAEAEDWYSRALDETPHDSVLWGNLALARENRTDGDPLDRWTRTLEALERAVSEGEPRPDPEYVQRRDRIGARLRLARRYGIRALEMEIAPKPLGLDVGSGLLREVVSPGTLELSPRCLETVERVRNRVRARTGLTLPGIHFRDWLAAPHPHAYLALLNGLPVVQSEVPGDRVLVFSGEAGPQWEATFPAAADPLSGEPGRWMTPEEVPEGGDLPTQWAGLEFALHELAAVYLRNARTEVHLDDVAVLLPSMGDPDLADRGGRTEHLHRVTQVVRNLVAEGAPATELGPIVEMVVRAPPDRGITELVEEARMLPGIRERLPGNAPPLPLVRLGPELGRGLRTGVRKGESEPALALPPEDCQLLFDRIRSALGGETGRHAVLTDDDLRPFVRWVLGVEFPRTPVLAEREIDPSRAVTTVVDLEPTPAGAGS
jgi:tetratricopeptide (TPR) repeat protein